MKLRNLLPCVCGATAAILAAPVAHALSLSVDGSGDAIVLPYYTVADGQSTIFSVVNHSDEAKAVRVLIAEGRNGRGALAYNVYLRARDTWAGAIIEGPGGVPMVVSNDTTCTAPAIPAGGEMLRDALFSGSRDDDLGDDIARLQTGQIELIEMATLTGAPAAQLAAGECNALRARLSSGGAWAADPLADTAAPTGGISGEARLVDVAGGTAMDIPSFGFTGFSGVSRHGVPSVNFADVRIYRPTLAPQQSEFMVGSIELPASRAADAASLVLMTAELEGSFSLNDSMHASTDWVVTFPTRAAYLDNRVGGVLPAGTAPVAPFANDPAPTGTAPNCTSSDWQTISRAGDLGPAVDMPLCEQVNVVTLAHAAGNPADANPTFSTAGVEEGRVRLNLRAEHGIAYIDASTKEDGNVIGLPAIGFSLMRLQNANAQPGLLATYAMTGNTVRKYESSVD
jgi:hypothetical protein